MDFGHNKEDWQSLKMIWQVYIKKKNLKRECKILPTQDLKPFQWVHVVWICTYHDYK